ncbi:glutathione S-transferase Mu 1-like isoform X4 [Gopherus flavomarginatus]|uniref:glutathione S-transferase Mu 1-like isoform X4 n=1 Tax=Gopherus flavomarginatus TaxID=286002 RepID=UPI0021CBE713|nr:glutathione S-transferase Mu 1-like isoform X4 [Gopherus flavomarginatus]
MPMVLGYWDIRGLAHAIRLLLEYTGTAYEDKMYSCGEGGETEEEMLRVDMLENQAMDFRMSLVMIAYNPDFEKVKPGYLEQLPEKLKLVSQFLGKRKWFAGEKITFVDFLMYDILDQNRMFEPKCLDQFQNLKDFLDRFEALEKIAAYMSSSRFMKTPINNRMAKWSNQKK